MNVHFMNATIRTTLCLIIFMWGVTSCSTLEEFANSQLQQQQEPNIAAGLKEALRVGAHTAVDQLAKPGGYLKDEAVKILLPDEMKDQISALKAAEFDVFGLATISGEELYQTGVPALNINSLADVEKQVITGINWAAERAAAEAAPIFIDAITSMTIADAKQILFGPDDAATTFLKNATYSALMNAYKPEIDRAVQSVTIGNRSVKDLYGSFVSQYNGVLSKEIPTGLTRREPLSSLIGLEQIAEPDLVQHATGQALDGLFLYIQKQEQAIRENPAERVTDLLKDVFSMQDESAHSAY